MWKMILPAMGVLLLTGLMRAAEPGVGRDVVDKHAKEMAAAVPAGWTVRTDGIFIQVERKQPVPVEMTGPGGPAHMAGETPLMRAPSFSLRVGPPRSEAQVAALQKSNVDLEKALEMMRRQMKDMEAVVKPNADTESFVARTPDQQARLDAFVAVKRAMPRAWIPKLFAVDASFNVLDDGFAPTQEADRTEMEAVRQKVEGLFASKPLN